MEQDSVVVLPGGCTSKAWLVDVSLNQPIKNTVRGVLEEFMASNIAQGPVSEAPAPTKNDVVDWIIRAPCTASITATVCCKVVQSV